MEKEYTVCINIVSYVSIWLNFGMGFCIIGYIYVGIVEHCEFPMSEVRGQCLLSRVQLFAHVM